MDISWVQLPKSLKKLRVSLVGTVRAFTCSLEKSANQIIINTNCSNLIIVNLHKEICSYTQFFTNIERVSFLVNQLECGASESLSPHTTTPFLLISQEVGGFRVGSLLPASASRSSIE